MIRIGLMGCGVVAQYGHIPSIQRTSGLELHSIFEPDEHRRLDTQRRFNIAHAFGDVDAFFQSGIDAVVIASPAPTHLENVRLSAKYGLPVLCEKPLAMNDADSAAMIRIMNDANKALYVGFTYRFATPAMKIRDLVAEGAIGRVRSIRLIYDWDCHGKFNDRQESHGVDLRRVGRMEEGGPMVDCGVHQIDLARWWLGSEIVRFNGVGVWVEDFESPDHVYLHADHENGCHTLVEMSYSYGHTASEPRSHFLYELIGTEGLIKYDRQARVFEMVNTTGVHPLNWDYEKNFDGMHQEFEKALRTGQTGHMPTGTDGLAATLVARTATEQAMRDKKGRSITDTLRATLQPQNPATV